jgi:hypothetical protein
MNDKTDMDIKFRQILKEMMQEHRSKANMLSSTGDTEAAVLETIRHNITEIYLKLFDVSRRDPIPPYNTRICDIIRECPDPEERAHRVFLYYLETISRSWETGLETARQHDDPETIMKESIKLEMRDAIRNSYRMTRSDNQRMEI